MTQRTRTPNTSPTTTASIQSGNKEARAAIEKMIAPSLPKVSDFKTTREKLHYVADVIEKQALIEKGVGFNMADYYSDAYQDQKGNACGTIACIAGTAMFLENGSLLAPGKNYLYPAMQLLGIDYNDASELFTIENGRVNLSCVTHEHAVAVIRDFADNGMVRWDCFDSEGKPCDPEDY